MADLAASREGRGRLFHNSYLFTSVSCPGAYLQRIESIRGGSMDLHFDCVFYYVSDLEAAIRFL